MHFTFDPADPAAGSKLLEDLTTNVDNIQQHVLKEILARNANTEYLNGQSDKELFKKKVPIVDYENILPYIERIADGGPSDVILAQPITQLIRGSATSGGRQKLIPMTSEELDRRTNFLNLIVAVLNKYLEGLDQGKVLSFVFIKPEFRTSGGLVVLPSISSYYKSSSFKNRPFNPLNTQTSPDEIILCPDTKQSMYCQLLSGLVQRDEVLRVGTSFASAFLHVIKFLEDHWQELCSNLRTGQVSEWITNSGCRKALSLVLNNKMPDLAYLIERECGGGSWEGILQRLWPKAKCVEVIYTGSMSPCIPILEYYSGNLPLVSMRYVSSEGYFGINLNPLSKPSEVSYTLLPSMAYYEFLPFDNTRKELTQEDSHNGITDPNCTVIDLANVKIGQYYELLITTFTGLYRYKVGDILMVTGFHNNAPKFQFVLSRGVVLSVDFDKTSEEDLSRAISRAILIIESLGLLLKEYTSHADTSSYPGHYVLFWELQTRENAELPKLDQTIMEQCCFTMEQSLNSLYRLLRNVKHVGPLEIRVVNQGSFEALTDYYLAQGSSVSQYKTPSCIKSEKAIEILNSRVVARFFSRSVPFWKPLDSTADQISDINVKVGPE